MRLVHTLALALALSGAAIAAAGAEPEPAAPAEGRTVQLPLPVPGTAVALYLPAGHDPAKRWPLVVFLPGYEKTVEDWVKLWKPAADRAGFVLAIPVPTKPDAQNGFPDVVPVTMARAAIAAAGADPERVVLAGQFAGGATAYRTTFAYPRLARAAVGVACPPPALNPNAEFAPLLPPLLLIADQDQALRAARAYAQANRGLTLTVLRLDRAEGVFSEQACNAILNWLSRGLRMGSSAPPEVPRPEPDPAAAAALVEEADKLLDRGAESGAYILLLRAARADPGGGRAPARLARLCLDGRRLAEAVEWSDQAAAGGRTDPETELAAAEALLKSGRAREALARLEAAGPSARDLAEKVRKNLTRLAAGDAAAATGHYRQAIERLAAGQAAEAAAAARSAVKAAPCEAAYRVLAVYAVFAAEGLAAAQGELAEYLESFPRDPYVRPLADALAATGRTDYARAGRPASAELSVGTLPPAGPGAAMIAAMARRAGRCPDADALARRLAAAIGAGRSLRHALPVLEVARVPCSVGRGSLDDLRDKLSAGSPVLVQMPPGELAGLRASERFDTGVPRLAVGFDDAAKCVLLLDYGAAKPLRVPYALFDLLWSKLDRWWLAVQPAKGTLPGLPGDLTAIEMATALAESGDLRGARPRLEELLKSHPDRARLALGSLLRGADPKEARRHLEPLAAAGGELAPQAEQFLGMIEDVSPGTPAERAGRSLPHHRRAWRADPGNEVATLLLGAALLTRGAPGDAAEARTLVEDYLRLRPVSIPLLRLRYAK